MVGSILISPISEVNSLKEVFSSADLFNSDVPCFYRRDLLVGRQSSSEQQLFDGIFFSLPQGRLIFDHHVLYSTHDNRFIPSAYPKSWPYAQFSDADSDCLKIDFSGFEQSDFDGAWLAPCNVAATPHLYHSLFDNYARMYFADELPPEEPVSVLITAHSALGPDMDIIHQSFAGRYPGAFVKRGIYNFERLIIPPLANKNDYMFAEPTAYLSRTLSSLVKKKTHTYKTRVYVSRADTNIRNLTNEKELVDALRTLGFIILCPGEYHIKTQLEIFAAAEIIIGLHGMGLMPMLVARDCKAVFEYEALGWGATAFRGIAANMGLYYESLPCRLISNNPDVLADWTAEADVDATVSRIQARLTAAA